MARRPAGTPIRTPLDVQLNAVAETPARLRFVLQHALATLDEHVLVHSRPLPVVGCRPFCAGKQGRKQLWNAQQVAADRVPVR
jgi:hypothetical protein